MDITPLLSQNALSMRRSQIRDLLSVATRPEIISFAGGFPNPATFPLEELKDIMKEVLETEGYAALQYGSTEGVVALRKEISKLYKREEGLDVPIENILITTASQQALDLISRIFINPGDVVVCGLPSYLGALQAFWSYQGNPYGLRHNRGLDEACNVLCATGKKPKFLYSIPDFQNPSGETMTLEEREYAVGVAQKYDLLIVEDTPYKNIRFSGESLPSMYSMDPSRVIMLGTFSKTFVPGFRLGWIVAVGRPLHAGLLPDGRGQVSGLRRLRREPEEDLRALQAQERADGQVVRRVHARRREVDQPGRRSLPLPEASRAI